MAEKKNGKRRIEKGWMIERFKRIKKDKCERRGEKY